VDKNKPLGEAHIIHSNSIKALEEDLKRMDLFTTLVKKKPTSLTDLAKLLGKDYTNVLNEVQILESMGIIKLEKEAEEIRPIALYEQIIFDFSVQQPLINMIQMETVTG
ncbi:30591_t:CDS:1, partial [Racocetra persica]